MFAAVSGSMCLSCQGPGQGQHHWRLFTIKATLLFQNVKKNIFPLSFFHPITPDLRFPDKTSWPGGGRGNKWILSCVFKVISHSLLLPLVVRRTVDICAVHLRIPGRSSASSFILKFKQKYLHRGRVFYFPSFHPPWGSHVLLDAQQDSHHHAAAQQSACCWRENKLIMRSCDHFCDSWATLVLFW